MMGVAYEMIGRLFSRQQMKKLGALLDSSGASFIPEAFAGFVVLLSILCSVFMYLSISTMGFARSIFFRICLMVSADMTASTPHFFTSVSLLIATVFSFILVSVATYVALYMMASSRKKKVEDSLPDFLSLSAANMRAGMTIDQAMWYAAKPEFGILSAEVSIVAKKAFGGVPFNQAIDHLPARFDSKSLRRAVSLIKQGIASGGKLADILERTAEESRQIQILRKEIASSLIMYVIFIVFAGAIGTPFLFAVSGRLVSMVEHIFLSLPANAGQAAAGFGTSLAVPTKTVISSSDFFIFTLACSAITAIFASLIIGVISHGSKKEGVVYLPFMLLLSFAIFFAISAVLDSFLSGIAG